MTEYLSLGDYLAIAETVTGIDAEVLARSDRIGLADSALHAPQAEFGGVEFYPDFAMKAAVLCSRLARNHPLVPIGNKRAAYASLRMFVRRNGLQWIGTSDPEETIAMMNAVAAGEVSEEDLAEWVRARLG